MERTNRKGGSISNRSDGVQHVQSIQSGAPSVVDDVSADFARVRLDVGVVDTSDESNLKGKEKKKGASKERGHFYWNQPGEP